MGREDSVIEALLASSVTTREAKVAAADMISGLQSRVSDLEKDLGEARSNLAEASKAWDSPETSDFLAGTRLEAAHQVASWGVSHDAKKTAWDWFWLVGYLAQKAATSAVAGDVVTARHHTISTAAALLNWHSQIVGGASDMETKRDGYFPNPEAHGRERQAFRLGWRDGTDAHRWRAAHEARNETCGNCGCRDWRRPYSEELNALDMTKRECGKCERVRDDIDPASEETRG